MMVKGLACQLEIIEQRRSPSGVNVLQRCIGLVNSNNVGVQLGLATPWAIEVYHTTRRENSYCCSVTICTTAIPTF